MLLKEIIQTIQRLARQRRFLSKEVGPVIRAAQSRNDGSLYESDFRKITHYYGLAVPAVLGEAFCAWQGRNMSLRERACSTGQGAMTGLFDDFFDIAYLDNEQITQLMQDRDTSAKQSNEALFRHFFRMALEHAPDRSAVQQTLKDVYNAQVTSRLQTKGQLNEEQIRAITLEKGGASLLFYRTAFSPAADEAERRMLFRLGGLMQLSNDIFDVFKDREAGIDTLLTTATHIKPLAQWFREQLTADMQITLKIASHPVRARNFLSILCMGIFCRVMVCLDQLEELENRSDGTFDLHDYSRTDLICDMELWKNRIRAARYFNQLMKRVIPA